MTVAKHVLVNDPDTKDPDVIFSSSFASSFLHKVYGARGKVWYK